MRKWYLRGGDKRHESIVQLPHLINQPRVQFGTQGLHYRILLFDIHAAILS